jgi:tetratricopeptide (TPR) repeat protein
MRLLILALAAAAALLGAGPAWATWRKAETANFILYSQSSEAKVREQAALLEDYHGFLRTLTGITDPPAPNKLRVYLVRGRGQLRQVRDVGSGVAGFYTASPSGIAAFVDDRSGGWIGDDQILFHEIAHHFMLQYRPSAYPAWFVEGFAEYVMTARFKDNVIEFGHPNENRIGWLRNARWLPFEKVLFEGVPKGQESALFYGQSWLLTHYLMRDDDRIEKFRTYLRAITAGTPPRQAFAEQFGELRGFERAIQTYGARQMTFTRLTRASAAAAPQVKVETLPPAADDLLLMDANLYVGVGDRYVPELLERVRTEAAKHPGDAYAQRVLAKAEALYGDAEKGEKAIDALIAAQPNDAELLYVKGMRYLRAGRADAASRAVRFRQARPWFVRAHKLDKHHFPTLAAYAESLTTDRQFNSENTLEIVLLARELAPQVLELNMNAANLLLLRGHFAEAEAVLRPIASNPHNAGLAAAAQAMIERARAKQGPTSAAPVKPAGE